jgi:hypothetical protein
VKRITLEVVLVSTVAGRWTEEKVNAVPHEGKWGTEKDKAGKHARIVVEMLHRMHAESRKGLCISITMVQAVNLLIQRSEMKEAVGKIEV